MSTSLKMFLAKRVLPIAQVRGELDQQCELEQAADEYIKELKDELQIAFLSLDRKHPGWHQALRDTYLEGFDRARNITLAFLRGNNNTKEAMRSDELRE